MDGAVDDGAISKTHHLEDLVYRVAEAIKELLGNVDCDGAFLVLFHLQSAPGVVERALRLDNQFANGFDQKLIPGAPAAAHFPRNLFEGGSAIAVWKSILFHVKYT